LFESPPLDRTLTPIYDFLRARGHKPEGDAVSVCGWPVQFLPAESPLLKEAVEQAVTVDFEGVPTRVMTAEHLAAIALQTGRAKDFTRLLAFVESGTLAADKLKEIFVRHQLADAWSRFEAKYLNHPWPCSPRSGWRKLPGGRGCGDHMLTSAVLPFTQPELGGENSSFCR
jgi:hypothetical protein